MLTMWLILPKWNNKNNELLSQPSELPRSQCFRYPDHVSLGYSLPPSGLIEIKRKSFKLHIFCVLLCPSIASHLGWNFQQLVVIWQNSYWPNLVGPAGKIFSSGSVQPKFLFLNAKLSLRDNELVVFANFSFSSGCDLHDRSQNY